MTAIETLNGRQFQQLPLYMTSHEMGGFESGDFGGKMRDTYAKVRKAAEFYHGRRGKGGLNHLDMVKRDIEASHGIDNPVTVDLGKYENMISDGHHRSTVAHETGRLIPVRFRDTAKWAPH